MLKGIILRSQDLRSRVTPNVGRFDLIFPQKGGRRMFHAMTISAIHGCLCALHRNGINTSMTEAAPDDFWRDEVEGSTINGLIVQEGCKHQLLHCRQKRLQTTYAHLGTLHLLQSCFFTEVEELLVRRMLHPIGKRWIRTFLGHFIQTLRQRRARKLVSLKIGWIDALVRKLLDADRLHHTTNQLGLAPTTRRLSKCLLFVRNNLFFLRIQFKSKKIPQFS